MEHEIGYNPDILSCLANLSNDEVFTPPEVANAVLDMIPESFWSDPNVRVLDPCTKSGVFLREAAKRFLKGLEKIIPNLQERIDHVFHKQLYGFAITELTGYLSRRSLYCSKNAHGDYAVSAFKSESGNIIYNNIKHTWNGDSCKYCGASKSEYNRSKELDQHAYEFIHLSEKKLKEYQKVHFDLIIGNPPYQLSDGGNKASAKPIYQLFVEQAKKLRPRYLTMIMPARWYSGGKGLDEFRATMLNDKHIRKLIDYTDSTECFPGVDIAGGVCYFLWDRDHEGLCSYTNHFRGDSVSVEKKLNEYATFIRYPIADEIVAKIMSFNEAKMSSMVTTRKPFGLATNAVPMSSGELTLRYNKGTGPYEREAITTGVEYIDKWKVMLSYLSAEHAGQPDKEGMFKILSSLGLLPPKYVCTETYLLAGAFEEKEKAVNLEKYLATRFVRFLIGQIAVSQHITKACFAFVPVQDFSITWTDEDLYKKYDLSDKEIEFIESMIRPIEVKADNYE